MVGSNELARRINEVGTRWGKNQGWYLGGLESMVFLFQGAANKWSFQTTGMTVSIGHGSDNQDMPGRAVWFILILILILHPQQDTT